MLWFGEAMIDVALGAGVFEGMRPDRLTGVDRGLNSPLTKSGFIDSV